MPSAMPRLAALALFAAAAPAAAQIIPQDPLPPGLVPPSTVPPLVEPGQANLFFDYFLFDNLGQPRENIRGQQQGDLTGFIQWNVLGGSVDLVGGNVPGVFGAPPTENGGRYVDLIGSTGTGALFETNRQFAVTALDTYRLRFQYRSVGGDANTAFVDVGGQRFEVGTSSTEFQLFDQQLRFTDLQVAGLAGLVRIGFQNQTGTSGIGIDSVLFDQLLPAVPPTPVAGVPEPATWTAMFLGFAAIGWATRRRPRVRFAA